MKLHALFIISLIMFPAIMPNRVAGKSSGDLCEELADLYYEKAVIKDKGITEDEQVEGLKKELLEELSSATGDEEKDAIEFKYSVILRTIWDVYKYGDNTALENRDMVLDRCSVIDGKIHFLGL